MRWHQSLFDQPVEIAQMDYTHLTREERYQIYALKKAGHKQYEIAELLERSPSTISRELARSHGGRGYRPRQTQEMAEGRRTDDRRGNVAAGHSSLQTTQRYIDGDVEARRKIVDLV